VRCFTFDAGCGLFGIRQIVRRVLLDTGRLWLRSDLRGLRGAAQTVLQRRRSIASSLRKTDMKTDAQLRQDVIAQLDWEPAIHATQIGVEVKDGIVTLAGEVGTYSEKWYAERAAQRVSGVKALAVEMKVKLAGSARRTDSDIGQSARNVLDWTTSVDSGAVKVQVEGGWITLSGEVDWQYQKQAASDAVRALMGVTGVSDQIGIKHKPKASIVKADIDAAIKRSAVRDSDEILVEVMGTDVTLTGKVHSWSERDLATDSAWSSPGVRNVIDKMTLSF
jgi:osmotically-inducible protein OsmY